jgi:hypothetical protein
VTAPARITQADMTRAVKAARAAAPDARIIVDLARQRLEIIIGSTQASVEENPWDDDDGEA